jgi:hypothetical protein
MKKTILKKIRPLYEYVKSKPYLAHIPLSIIESYNDFISRKYQKKLFSETKHFNCNNQSIENQYELDLITVAFNKVSLIENQIKFLQKNLKDSYFFTVADNSNDPQASEEIRQICISNKVGYIKLFPNPWKQANLSHGVVLNWIYHNYVKPRKAKYFGFIDHDIFPIQSTSLTEKFNTEKIMYGHLQERTYGSKTLWYLWAGFCFYKSSVFVGKKPNFNPSIITSYKDIFELDTGGRNWKYIYKDIQLEKVSIAHSYFKDGFQNIDDWIHLEKASFKKTEEINLFLDNIHKQAV